jgi:hypothetical protein
MRWRHCLLVIVAGLMTSGASCKGPTASSSQLPPPASCLEECQPYLSALPDTPDNVRRMLWEYRVMREYAACAGLHNSCVAENNRRLGSDTLSR